MAEVVTYLLSHFILLVVTYLFQECHSDKRKWLGDYLSLDLSYSHLSISVKAAPFIVKS